MSRLHPTNGPGRPKFPPAARRLRALVLVEGEPGPRPAGPEIRGWALARALATRHDVVVAARVRSASARDGIPVIPATRGRLLRAAARSHVVVAPWVPPFLYAAPWASRARFVADLYDPAEVELRGAPAGAQDAGSVRRLTELQATYADALLCAGERQRERLRDLLEHAPAPLPEVIVVPLGAPPPPPRPAAGRLRERLGLTPGDTVVLWWGTPWRWLDVSTAVRALTLLAPSRPDIKLVVTAGEPASADARGLSAAGDARRTAEAAGVLGEGVFLLEEWVPYDERLDYLSDADIGLTLHPPGEESRVAARMRYLDYAWAGLPCVLARGDELGEALADAGCATLVEPGDAEAVARAIVTLADDPERRSAAAAAGRRFASEHDWAAATRPLVDLVESPEFLAGAPRRRRRALRVTAAVTAYYAARLSRRFRRSASPP